MLDQIISSFSSIIIENEKKYDVENIINSRLINRLFNKHFQYKIRWVKHSSNRKWYLVENFDHAKKIVIDYHQRYFNKSKSQFFNIQFMIISLISHLNNSRSWARQSIHETKDMIQDILNRMKKEMKSMIKTSIFNVDRNFINIKAANQDCFVIKTISVERILFNQKKKENNVTISCHSSDQMIDIKKN
jgi:sugar-specific transcriptional regulator TrmB